MATRAGTALPVVWTTLLFGVLGVLVLDDVQCLVLGEDAEEPVVAVHDREFLQAPVHAQPCGLLGSGERLDRDDVGVNQVCHGAIGLRNHQAAERHRAEQQLVGISNIDAVAGVGVLVLFGDPVTDVCHRLFGRGRRVERQGLRRHVGSYRIRRPHKHLAQLLGLFDRHHRQQRIPRVVVEPAQNSDRVVGIHGGEKFGGARNRQ